MHLLIDYAFTNQAIDFSINNNKSMIQALKFSEPEVMFLFLFYRVD